MELQWLLLEFFGKLGTHGSALERSDFADVLLPEID